MKESLQEKGLRIIREQISLRENESNEGTEFLNRSIYYAKERTDADGNIVKDSNGDPVVEVLVYRTMGSYLSKTMMKRALEIEFEFQELNDTIRLDATNRGIRWRIRPTDNRTVEFNVEPEVNGISVYQHK